MSWIVALTETGLNDVVHEYFKQLSLASNRLHYEIQQATRIQAWWKGVLHRIRLKVLNNHAVIIQRTYRGYQGRQAFKIAKQKHKELLQKLVCDYAATMIQKIYRGVFSRKTRLDFYSRKKYIESVRMEGDELKRKLTEQLELSRQITQEKEKKEAAQEFHIITAGLHHLLSTAGRPGIFRSPYGEAYSAKAFDIPVEDHIRDAFKDSFRKSKIGKKLYEKERLKERLSTERSKMNKL